MKNIGTKIFATILFILFCEAGITQEKEITDTLKNNKPTSFFKTSLSYLSNVVYDGRKDSAVTPYITPTIGYYNKRGFNISASISYNPNDKLVDLFLLDAGYDFDIIKDKLSLSLDVSRNFYNTASTSIRSGSKGWLGADLTYDLNIVSINAGAGLDFSDKTGIGASLALSHQFDIDDNKTKTKWSIMPTITANWGTEKFYLAYQTKVAKKKNKSITTVEASGNNNFNILDYELGVPINFDAKKWGFAFTPTYAIPESPITTTITTTTVNAGQTKTKTTTETEQLSNIFYCQATIYFKF